MIIDGAGPVASTVVGHFKTCLIITIGWVYSQRPLKDGGMIGIVLAVGGIIAFVTLPCMFCHTPTICRYTMVSMKAAK